ncbi:MULTISPECIES: nitrite reductase large subunit NirB [Staphylococcaceae]|uniref:nitrite reductase large subunit NirB n=1 Tax=Staphylococcaceae TaxID=90964 RepID=UPI001F3F7349|nr:MULTISPECIES: nitrite reductase large subunit NirB [Staphylococcaceae]MCE5035089.1 nitrite reductase large subunit NirB [Staphylococcus cohnii]
MSKEQLVMIGNGMAGVRTIEEILERDPDKFDITIIGKEPYPNYNRIMLSNILQKKMTMDETITHPYEWYKENGIRLINNDMVVSINRQEQTVTTNSDTNVAYDKLIIATGSESFILPIDGSRLEGVMGWRTINDTNQMIEMAKTKNKAVVIGGGLLGLECARGLLDQGMEVTVVHLAEWLMEMQLDRKAGMLLQEDLENQGMKFEVQANTQEILGDKKVEGIRLSDGRVIDTDMVVMAAGIRPVTKQARAAELEIGRGIIVDDFMRTSDENIYAVGECAEHNSKVYGLVAPLYDQGKVLADHITGRETKGYKGSTTFTSLKVSGCDLFSAGKIYESDSIRGIEVFDSVNRHYKKIFIQDGQIVGAVIYGDTEDGNRYYNMMKKSEKIDEYTLVSVLHKAGAVDEISVASMSDDETVCGCNGVCKGDIVSAIKGKDLQSVAEVTKVTKAGNSCGKCKPQVAELLELTLGDDFVANSPTGICGCTDLDRDQIVAEIKSKELMTSKEVRHVLDFKDKDGCPKCRPAINYYLNMIYPHDHKDEKESRFANERYKANIQNDGTFSVIPQMQGGVTNADQLIRLGEVAKKYDIRLVKITGAQRIGLYGLKKDDLPKVWSDLGMKSAAAYAKSTRSVKSCVGKEFCRFGTQFTTKLGIRLEDTFEYIDTPHKFKMGVSGCPRSCVESGVKDFGVIGVENGFQIFIGGNGGTDVVAGELLTTVETEDEVVKLCGAMMQYYRETGIYGERTAPWLERLGFDHVKEVLLDPEKQQALYDEIIDVKRALDEPWSQIIDDKEKQKIFDVERV